MGGLNETLGAHIRPAAVTDGVRTLSRYKGAYRIYMVKTKHMNLRKLKHACEVIVLVLAAAAIALIMASANAQLLFSGLI